MRPLDMRAVPAPIADALHKRDRLAEILQRVLKLLAAVVNITQRQIQIRHLSFVIQVGEQLQTEQVVFQGLVQIILMLAENGQIVVDQRDVFTRVLRLENLQRGMRLLHCRRELPRAIQHPTLIHEKLTHLQGVGVVGKQHKRLFIHTRCVVLETTLLIHAANVAQKIRL